MAKLRFQDVVWGGPALGRKKWEEQKVLRIIR